MIEIINKTMSRSDLLSEDARPVIDRINELIHKLYSKNLYMSSWYGSLEDRSGRRLDYSRAKHLIRRLLRRSKGNAEIGMANRGPDYEPLPHSADDERIPWYLYWQIFWVLGKGPSLSKGQRILDIGGASSLFSCYLASLGFEVHSIDVDERLVDNAKKIARVMDWDMHSYTMNAKQLDFNDRFFDHAYSICLFEHLNYDAKQQALAEICRCLKPRGILSVTFDYRNPAPYIAGFGPDISKRNQLKTEQDIKRNFLVTDYFKLVGNQNFVNNGESYLVHPLISSWPVNNIPYTFGAIFLKKKD